jgi:hypothetical protein
VTTEPLSPELALVDPELGARARAALGYPAPPPRAPRLAPAEPSPRRREHRPRARPAPPPTPPAAELPRTSRRYPLWARIAATLWVLVIGILIGGTAVPHAEDRPRVVPPAEDATLCERPQQPGPLPARPLGPAPARPARP